MNQYNLKTGELKRIKYYVERWTGDWDRRFKPCRYDRKTFEEARQKTSHDLRSKDVHDAVIRGFRTFIDFYQEFIDLDWTDDPREFGKHLGQAAATCEFFQDVLDGRILPF